MTSVVVGSCRQSVKTPIGEPGLATRRHSLSHSEHQYPNERWSRLSPANSGRSTCVPVSVYFADVDPARSPRVKPPDEYGGSVMTASTLPVGIDRRTARASPLWSTQRAVTAVTAQPPGRELHAGSRAELGSPFLLASEQSP